MKGSRQPYERNRNKAGRAGTRKEGSLISGSLPNRLALGCAHQLLQEGKMEEEQKEVVPNYLYHIWGDTDEEFFKRIDHFGGWPTGAAWVGFDHGVVRYRPCKFYDREIRSGWITTHYCADDYYWWKLSEARKLEYKQKVASEVASVIRNLQWKKS